jgi:hypothetical protein
MEVTIGGRDISVGGKLVRIAYPVGDGYHFLEEPEALFESIRKSKTRIDLFTFMQRLPETQPKFKYPMEWDNFAALPISTFDNWWNKQIGFKARNKAKQAEKKGVVVRRATFDDELVRGIWEVYNETMVRQGKPNAHYGKDLERVRKEEETFMDHSVFIGAFLEHKLIGFIKLVADPTGNQAGLMNIVSMIQHRDKAPTNALLVEAVRICAERQIPYLVYSSFAYGKKQTSTLSDFKERNGFQRIEIPRYYVPLTSLGRAAYRLKLHKQFADRLPAPLLAKLRGLRNSWYNRKLQSVPEAS